MKPIYEPRGAAKEYGDYAINIYTGCPHRCFYCFAPSVLHRDREEFHSCVKPREGIVEAVKAQIEREHLTGKLIHLCFTCDPYPSALDRESRARDPIDSTPTREIIKLLKDSGNNVQILTKNPTKRDFDLLDENDWFGVTYDGGFRVGGFIPFLHMPVLQAAQKKGIKTWISFEPVVNAEAVLQAIEDTADYVDKIKIGKLNYHKSDINWKKFGEQAEALCKELGLNYYIKDSLRNEMDRR